MIRIFLFLFLLIGILSCGETDPAKDLETVENKDDDGNVTEKYSRRKDTFAKEGLYQAFFAGKLSEEANYTNDTLHGERKLYFANGKPEIIENYKNGQFDGTWQEFYESGQLKMVGSYKNNEGSGIWKTYYETGKLKEEVRLEKSEENGPFKEYHQNGNLKTEGTYSDGSETGEMKEYDENGEMTAKKHCWKGVCQTVWSPEEGDIEFNEEEFNVKVERMKKIEVETL